MTISSNNIYIKHWVNIVLMFFSVYRRIFFPSGTSCQCFKFSQSRRELALFKALAEFKASRRLGKYIRCFKCFLYKRWTEFSVYITPNVGRTIFTFFL